MAVSNIMYFTFNTAVSAAERCLRPPIYAQGSSFIPTVALVKGSITPPVSSGQVPRTVTPFSKIKKAANKERTK